jgi:hypothetical protein
MEPRQVDNRRRPFTLAEALRDLPEEYPHGCGSAKRLLPAIQTRTGTTDLVLVECRLPIRNRDMFRAHSEYPTLWSAALQKVTNCQRVRASPWRIRTLTIVTAQRAVRAAFLSAFVQFTAVLATSP